MKKDKKEFYVVEEGVPIPAEKASRWQFGEAPTKKLYPFEEMQVGDSFLAPIYKRHQAIMYSSKTWANRRGLKWEFKVQTVKDGIRCWRIK